MLHSRFIYTFKNTPTVMMLVSGIMVTNLTIPTWAAKPMPANFEPPPRRDAPRGGTTGGGSRPVALACASTSTLSNRTPVLTALSPGKYIGLSRLQRPTFFVLLSPGIAQSAEFSLFDGEMNGIYQTRIPISDRNGLISINLPEDAPSLVKNKIYYWSFAITCNPSDRTEDWVVGGWIEHVPLNQTLQQQLAKASAIERVSLYAKQAFWYDAVATIIELQHQQPLNTQISQSWKELFTSVGLNTIAIAN